MKRCACFLLLTALSAMLLATPGSSEVDPDLRRARLNMFDPAVAPVTMRSAAAFYPTAAVHARNPQPFPRGNRLPPLTYEFGGKTWGLDDLVSRTYTNALLIVRDGKIVYERYRNGATPSSPFLIHSISSQSRRC